LYILALASGIAVHDASKERGRLVVSRKYERFKEMNPYTQYSLLLEDGFARPIWATSVKNLLKTEP
jgi:hypothetical protein